MKKFSVLLACLIGVYTTAAACDVCGCSSGASYLGTMPQLNRSFLGLRFSQRSYVVNHPALSTGLAIPAQNEYYRSVDIFGRYFITRRLQVMALVPFNLYERKGSEGHIVNNGLGDVNLLAGYVLLNTGDSIMHRFKHTLIVNAGAKLPTGRYKINDNGDERYTNPAIQPGTGSVDGLFNLFYTLRYRKFGFTVDGNMRLSGKNSQGYQMGNRYTTSARVFLWQKLGWDWSILPSVGATYDYAAIDYKYGIRQTNTGGNGVFGTVGADVYYKKMALGAYYQHPLAYQYSGGLAQPVNRFTVQLLVTF